ncbi:RagB/SusD family nutrient uptake outer membrane protein [Pontimicrobium sp. IMCC45349]|uniref:RagB/SusD family nutrient uptake outer membrane protein n=1 Tax=Pontimicrobium sp. IMCC45349 TaxID=3391574 RepID=UPI0039A32879
MKNIYKTLVVVFSLLIVQSCDDELNQLPNNALSPSTYYNTAEDFDNAMRGVYSGFLGGSYYGGSLLSRPDIMTSNVILAQAGRRSNQAFHEWRHSPNLAWGMMFSPYVITNRANLIIENIDNLDDGPTKNNFLGEARTARALALFDMLKVYSKIPTQSADAGSSLGMPIITGTDPNVRELRPTVAESYAFVISELEASRSLINADNGVGRFNKDAVNALLSRAYLYNGQYQEAINAANAVNSAVADAASFPQVWLDGSEAGVIMKINQDRILDGVGIGIEWSQSVGGTVIPEYVMEFDMYNLYAGNDVRKTSYVQILPDADGNIYNAITKMYGEAGQVNGVVDPKIIRAAEVYLNKAEAHAMLGGQDAQALAALDMVRSNRYSGFVSGNETGAALLDAIKNERRLELFAEGHRLFDVKRWNEGISRSATNGEFFDGTGTPVPGSFLNLPAGSHLFELPIPQAEINVYPEFQQNPGY